MILVCNLLLKNTKINGITLFPFILLKNSSDKKNKILLNHEKIHLRQQLEMFIVFFYLWYVLEYYYLLIKFKNPYFAYQNISFEREAYSKEYDLNYLKTRKFWNFTKYLK
ncbi:hypothetical protein [Halpernia frigidisoli]|uniref:Peptidase M56 domain-containing protein n=1 Tax=Halpernia frigidisoli TaxID=1125876 RepID=A0A1I3IYW8_9FLAO|nr:hypothetical protein [Halpernia frigidisoli]SFI53026.1 hypothetical protein SAMN05443292_2847 [Halpernia frigidisoli]